MSANPVTEFVFHVQMEEDVSDDFSRFEASLEEIVRSAGDPDRLDEHRKAVDNARAWLSDNTGTEPAAMRRRLFDILAVLSDQLIEQAQNGSTDEEMRHLATAVDKKRHALAVLRALENDPARPADLLERLELENMQLHRVLNWAVATGLVSRLQIRDQVLYRLTALGQLALKQRDEPAWLQAAALLAQNALEARLLDDTSEEHVERCGALARHTGLSPEQVERSLAAYSRAVDPVASSRLATAILDAAGASRTILFEPPQIAAPASVQSGRSALSPSPERGRRFDLGTSYLFRSFERAGLVDLSIEECSTAVEGRGAPPRAPVISVSMGDWNPMAERLLDDFGVNVQLSDGYVRWHISDDGPVHFTREDDVDYGFIFRLYSDSTGLSHFLLGGLGEHGVAAACRSFYQGVERHLDKAPAGSFATVVQVGESGEPMRWGELESIQVFDPYTQGTLWESVESDPGPVPAPSWRKRGIRSTEPAHTHKAALFGHGVRDLPHEAGHVPQRYERYDTSLPMAASDRDRVDRMGGGPSGGGRAGFDG